MTAAGASTTAPQDAAGPDPGRPRPALAARTALSLGGVEARLLGRSVLVLAGLAAGAVAVYRFTLGPAQPAWWVAGWAIGYGQQVLALAVLAAAQLAAGRARRDGLGELYRSFPAAPGTRVLGQLLGVLGAVPASLLLIGGAAAALELRGVLGHPSLAPLAAGLVLVLAAGAIGVAVGTRLAHPLAGVLAAVALVVPFSQSNRFNGAFVWLFPWVRPNQLGWLPGPLAAYPPAGAHAVMLAGLTALAGLVALALVTGRRRLRIGLAVAAAAAAAVTGLAGVAQLRPIPAADLSRLAAEVADPAAVQHCTTAGQVRYCLYPAFRGQLPEIQAPVRAVLAQLPGRPARPLTIRQTATVDFSDPTLTHAHPAALQVRWRREAAATPAAVPTASSIYLTAGTWPAGAATPADFSLALSAAEWAVGLPPAAGLAGEDFSAQCVPLGQAREAVAIWLATRAAGVTASQVQPAGPGPGGPLNIVWMHGTPVAVWTYPGEGDSYLTALGPQPSYAGFLLAQAMSRLPARRVSRVLDGAWSTWLNGHTTQARLAAALGISLPRVPSYPGLNRLPPGPPPPQNPPCPS